MRELSHLLKVEDVLNVQVRKLSLGERMKCELIGALLHNPAVLFLDEPTIDLDIIAQENIRQFLKDYNQSKKTTILLTSHYMEDVEKLCKRIIIVKKKIIYDGNLQDFKNKYIKSKLLKITFTEEIKRKSVENYGKIYRLGSFWVEFEVVQEKTKEVIKNILNSHLPIDDIFINEIKIEKIIADIFKQ